MEDWRADTGGLRFYERELEAQATYAEFQMAVLNVSRSDLKNFWPVYALQQVLYARRTNVRGGIISGALPNSRPSVNSQSMHGICNVLNSTLHLMYRWVNI